MTMIRCLLTTLAYRAGVASAKPECVAGAPCGSNSSQEPYFFPKRGYDAATSNSLTPHVGPSDFSAGPAWIWQNEDDEFTKHAPSIDGQSNLYVATETWVRKFSPDGKILWAWRLRPESGVITTCLTLYEGSIFFVAGYIAAGQVASEVDAYSLDMLTGSLNWRVRTGHSHFGESHTVFVQNGTVLHSTIDTSNPFPFSANNQVSARSSKDGSKLWDYPVEEPIWNFMPATPGDGTLLFATQKSRAICLALETGQLLWDSSGFNDPGPRDINWGTGGGVLGPNGIFYAVGSRSVGGVLVGYRASNGEVVLRRKLPDLGNQYPAIGLQRSGSQSRLAVVMGIGPDPDGAETLFPKLGAGWLPSKIVRALFRLQLHWPRFRRWLEIPIRQSSLMAIDAVTGEDIWWMKDEAYDKHATLGDEERFMSKGGQSLVDGEMRSHVCWPDNWGIPLIAGDGTVYAASGFNGNLYAIKGDYNANGVIDPSEVSIFRTNVGFMNGPSLAPGMLAVCPCWGPMYVFRSVGR